MSITMEAETRNWDVDASIREMFEVEAKGHTMMAEIGAAAAWAYTAGTNEHYKGDAKAVAKYVYSLGGKTGDSIAQQVSKLANYLTVAGRWDGRGLETVEQVNEACGNVYNKCVKALVAIKKEFKGVPNPPTLQQVTDICSRETVKRERNKADHAWALVADARELQKVEQAETGEANADLAGIITKLVAYADSCGKTSDELRKQAERFGDDAGFIAKMNAERAKAA